MKGNPDSKQSKTRRSARGQVALPEHLTQRLTAYATTAGAVCAGMLGLAQPAQADIIVNNNPISIGINTTVPFQVNGITQFTFVDFFSDTGYRVTRSFGRLSVSPGMGHVLSNGSGHVSRLAKGAVIALGGAFAKNGALVESALRIYDPFSSTFNRFSAVGQWENKSGYFGFEFLSNGQTHFGWAHANVSLSWAAVTATISEFAYDTVANQGIQAGQTTAATPEPSTLALLALGSLGLGFLRRRKTVGSQP